jgi:hypothetical protein
VQDQTRRSTEVTAQTLAAARTLAATAQSLDRLSSRE